MNPYVELGQKIDLARDVSEPYFSSVDQVVKELKVSIEDTSTQVIVYGAYNAGKSTLINALLGREHATVNDKPTTDSVDSYQWNGYTIFDTPGINAPIEHEQTTEHQLKRCSIMLFVIRGGDLDSKDVYERLFEMLKRNKKVFVVFNHELSANEEKYLVVERINTILCKYSEKYEVSQKELSEICVCPVNVKTALKARLEDKELLLEHSGYKELTERIKDWLAIQEGKDRVLEGIKNKANEILFEPLLKLLKQEVKGIESTEVKLLRDDRLMLESRLSSLKSDVTNFISEQVASKKIEVEEILTSGEAGIDTRLKSLFEPLSCKLESWLSDQLGQVVSELNVDLAYEKVVGENDSNENILLNQASSIAKGAIQDKDNIKSGLLFLRKLKVPGIKGRWEKTFDKWAGKAAPMIQVATSLWDAYQEAKDEDEKNKAERERQVSIQRAIEDICLSVKGGLIGNAHSLISEELNSQVNLVQMKIDELSEAQSQVNSDYSQVIKLRGEMLAISH